MRIILPALGVLALGACMASEAETTSGVGFGNYTLYQQQQEYLARAAEPAPAPIQVAAAPAPAPVLAPAPAPIVVAAAPISETAITTAPLSATAAPAAVTSEIVTAPVQMVAVTAMPERSGPSVANVAAFALSTTHPIGQKMYRRSGGARVAAQERACARYASDSLAQEAFLEAGGPERDRLTLDPDGDGFACRWDPAAFRLARG